MRTFSLFIISILIGSNQAFYVCSISFFHILKKFEISMKMSHHKKTRVNKKNLSMEILYSFGDVGQNII